MPAEFDINILYKAINENANIFIQKDKDKKNIKFFSRFLSFDLKNKRILIDFPSCSEPGEILRKKEKIKIFFTYKNFRFIIFSQTIGKTKFSLRKGKIINALMVNLPTKIYDGDRRNFFRVPTPSFLVEISIQKKDESDKSIPDDFIFKAIIFEIAGGGIGVREDKTLLPMENGDNLKLTIFLDKELLQMEGMVRNSRSAPHSKKRTFGIEFDKNKMPHQTINKNIQTILHYVMKRQRELLQ